MFKIIKLLLELQSKVCDSDRCLGDFIIFTKDKSHRFIESDNPRVGFVYDGIKKLHQEIDSLKAELAASQAREEIAKKVIAEKRKEKK